MNGPTRRAMAPAFLSSGDLLADRRYEWAAQLREEGDLEAAADLLGQALEKAPGFASAAFALGEIRDQRGERAEAVAAFRKALAADPGDRLGAGLRLARLGAAEVRTAMSPDYVRTLFDQYAASFDDALVGALAYCGPALLLSAVEAACRGAGRPFGFRRALDLGCGTGLAGRAFRPNVGVLAGVDLSPAMIDKARETGAYDGLRVGDMLGFLRAECAGSADFVIAADVLVYVANLPAIFAEVARVLAPGGLFAFTLETHGGEGVILRDTLRYAHAAETVRASLAAAGLQVLALDPGSTRTEKGAPVPGLVVVARGEHLPSRGVAAALQRGTQ